MKRLLSLIDWRGAQLSLDRSANDGPDSPRVWIQIREDGAWTSAELDHAEAIRMRDALNRWIQEELTRRLALHLREEGRVRQAPQPLTASLHSAGDSQRQKDD